MATQNQSLDSVITVKVNYDGSTRRAKMALRDTAPKVLEQEVSKPSALASAISRRPSSGGVLSLNPIPFNFNVLK